MSRYWSLRVLHGKAHKPHQILDFSAGEQMFWQQKWARTINTVVTITFGMNFTVTKASYNPPPKSFEVKIIPSVFR